MTMGEGEERFKAREELQLVDLQKVEDLKLSLTGTF